MVMVRMVVSCSVVRWWIGASRVSPSVGDGCLAGWWRRGTQGAQSPHAAHTGARVNWAVPCTRTGAAQRERRPLAVRPRASQIPERGHHALAPPLHLPSNRRPPPPTHTSTTTRTWWWSSSPADLIPSDSVSTARSTSPCSSASAPSLWSDPERSMMHILLLPPLPPCCPLDPTAASTIRHPCVPFHGCGVCGDGGGESQGCLAHFQRPRRPQDIARHHEARDNKPHESSSAALHYGRGYQHEYVRPDGLITGAAAAAAKPNRQRASRAG
jgi:hypothetical protein